MADKFEKCQDCVNRKEYGCFLDGNCEEEKPSISSMWAIEYEPYYCNMCGEFAGYRLNTAKFTGICSFECAVKYRKLGRFPEPMDKRLNNGGS